MHILPLALTMSLALLLLCALCGAGLALLLLPPRLRASTLLLAPSLGLALLALLGFYGARAGLTMRHTLLLALLLAAAALAVAVRRRHRAGWTWTCTWRAARELLPPTRELLPLALLLAAAWLLNIAPLLAYGALIPIGDNWDVEFYLPLADLLTTHSYPTLAQAPPNPLRDLVRAPPTVHRAMGATYAQAMAGIVGGWRAWDTWVPTLALLRVLSLAGLYALLRAGLGVPVLGALAGVALAGSNALLLWTTYNSFGMGLGGLALLPAALLAAGAGAWRARNDRGGGAAARRPHLHLLAHADDLRRSGTRHRSGAALGAAAQRLARGGGARRAAAGRRCAARHAGRQRRWRRVSWRLRRAGDIHGHHRFHLAGGGGGQ